MPRPESERITLRDGTQLTIRPARPDDRERLTHAFAGLDPDTVYTRYFSYRSALSEAELDRLATMDFVREAMLVATVDTTSGEAIVASGRYIAIDATAATAEVAFTVEEDYQGRGIAGRLLARLGGIARANGIARFEAIVLGDNRAMLRVFERCGLPSTTSRREGDVVVTLDLERGTVAGPPAPAAGFD